MNSPGIFLFSFCSPGMEPSSKRSKGKSHPEKKLLRRKGNNAGSGESLSHSSISSSSASAEILSTEQETPRNDQDEVKKRVERLERVVLDNQEMTRENNELLMNLHDRIIPNPCCCACGIL